MSEQPAVSDERREAVDWTRIAGLIHEHVGVEESSLPTRLGGYGLALTGVRKAAEAIAALRPAPEPRSARYEDFYNRAGMMLDGASGRFMALPEKDRVRIGNDHHYRNQEIARLYAETGAVIDYHDERFTGRVCPHDEEICPCITGEPEPRSVGVEGLVGIADELEAMRDRWLMATPDKDYTPWAILTRNIGNLRALSTDTPGCSTDQGSVGSKAEAFSPSPSLATEPATPSEGVE